MAKLLMLRGLPASGKTSWAIALIDKEPGKYKRVSKDALRLMLDNNRWSKKNESFILALRNTIVVESLKKGWNIIVDDTNLNPIHQEVLQELAKENDAEFIIQDFTNISVEECIKQDQKRENYVGEKVIRDMYNQFLKPKSSKIEKLPGLKDAIICDLDGTLCLLDGRNPYDRDFENDQENPAVMDILRHHTNIIFVSGRSDKFRDVTQKWLDDRGLELFPLCMRKEGDIRKDSIIKQEIYEEHIKGKFNVSYVLDDRDQMVRMWRDLGLTCFQVASGDF